MSALIVALLLFGVLIAVSFMTTFQIAAWTLAWKKIADGNQRPGLVRLLEKAWRKK